MHSKRLHFFGFGLAFFCALTLVLISACNQIAPEKPTMPREKVSEIIADIFIADAAIISGYGPIRDTMQAYYYDQVFTLHGVTREDFQHQVALYSRDMVEMDSIIKKAEERLKEQNAQ